MDRVGDALRWTRAFTLIMMSESFDTSIWVPDIDSRKAGGAAIGGVGIHVLSLRCLFSCLGSSAFRLQKESTHMIWQFRVMSARTIRDTTHHCHSIIVHCSHFRKMKDEESKFVISPRCRGGAWARGE